jgi:RNA polymerase sigma-70 factor (ECF subfamily)
MNAATVAARDARSLGQASDEALLAQISRGDQAALGELYRRHRGTVRGYVLGRIARPDDADDVVQETFLRAAGQAAQYQPERSVPAWLRWQAGAQLREYGQRDLHPYLAAARASREQLRRPVTETAEHREATPLSEPVQAALARLTPGERRAIQLRYLDGLSPEQAAAIIGVRERSFHRRVAYGRRKLARDLADLAPAARSPLQDVPRPEAYTVALAKAGDNVPAATAWLQRHGIRTSEDTLYRHRHRLQTGTIPVERPRPVRAVQPADPAYNPPEHVTALANARDRARAAAVDYQARFGHLPTRRDIMTAAGVSESTAIRALRPLKAEPATAQPPRHGADLATAPAAATNADAVAPAGVSPSLTPRQQNRDGRTGTDTTADQTRRGDVVIEQARTVVGVLAAHRQLREQRRREDEQARVDQLNRWHHDDAQQAEARAREEWGLAR